MLSEILAEEDFHLKRRCTQCPAVKGTVVECEEHGWHTNSYEETTFRQYRGNGETPFSLGQRAPCDPNKATYGLSKVLQDVHINHFYLDISWKELDGIHIHILLPVAKHIWLPVAINDMNVLSIFVQFLYLNCRIKCQLCSKIRHVPIVICFHVYTCAFSGENDILVNHMAWSCYTMRDTDIIDQLISQS